MAVFAFCVLFLHIAMSKAMFWDTIFHVIAITLMIGYMASKARIISRDPLTISIQGIKDRE